MSPPEKQPGISGKIVSYNESTSKSDERTIEPGKDEEIFATSHFIYLPESRIVALEWTQSVPHQAAFADYFRQWALNNHISIEEFSLNKFPVTSPIDKIMEIEFAEKFKIKLSPTALSKLKGDTSIAKMLRDISKYHDKSGNFELEISAGKTKSGRRDVFLKTEIRDFWLKNQDIIDRLIVNENNKEQVYFGENQLILDIKVEEQLGNINATQLLDEVLQRLRAAKLG